MIGLTVYGGEAADYSNGSIPDVAVQPRIARYRLRWRFAGATTINVSCLIGFGGPEQ